MQRAREVVQASFRAVVDGAAAPLDACLALARDAEPVPPSQSSSAHLQAVSAPKACFCLQSYAERAILLLQIPWPGPLSVPRSCTQCCALLDCAPTKFVFTQMFKCADILAYGCQAPVGGYTTQRWPEDVGDPPRQAGAPAPGGDAAPAAAQGAAGPDWRAQVGGLQAGVDAQLRRTLADALLLLTPVRLGLCVRGAELLGHR